MSALPAAAEVFVLHIGPARRAEQRTNHQSSLSAAELQDDGEDTFAAVAVLNYDGIRGVPEARERNIAERCT